MTAPRPFRYSGDPALESAVTQALERVDDPEMALNIVDLGLIYDVATSPSATHVNLTMTSAACPVSELIVEDVKREVSHAMGPGHHVTVTLSFAPPWSPERMSAKARSALGWD
jgi:metal-sulfur cluster biosynthetic enzyme